MIKLNLATEIDWSAPWLGVCRELGLEVLTMNHPNPLNPLGQLNQCDDTSLVNALNRCKGELDFNFKDQDELGESFTYEAYVYRNRCIPTRANLHDFFNGLSWIKFSQTKEAMLNLQAAEFFKTSPHSVDLKSENTPFKASAPSARGAVRDSLTVFDENGILLQADERIWHALEQKDWRSLFLEHRALWQNSRVWVFGHALLEKLTNPRPTITGHVLRLNVPVGLVESDLDTWLAKHIPQLDWASKPFTPIQVLGIPGWWAANEEMGFYENTEVFRISKAAP